jgi:ABC-2 type transport system permease protein
MWERIGVMIRKEFAQTLRDRRSRSMLIIAPFMQLLLFGYAVTLDVEHARIAWMDMDGTPASRALLAQFEGSGRFEVIATPRSEQEVQDLLDRGRVHAVVRVLPRFGRDLARNEATAVQVLIDGTNSNTASLVSAYASAVIMGFSSTTLPLDPENRHAIHLNIRNLGTVAHPSFPQIRAQSRVWFNPDLHSRNYFVPGVAANILFMFTIMLTAQSIIREKEIGTLEQLMVTPLRPIELMLGKILPFAAIGIFNLLTIVGAALLIFRIPFRGNILLLLGCSLLFLMTTLGIGLFLSSISQTQQQSNMAAFFFNMPAFMLSGFNFPIRNMPVAVQYLTYLNPLRYFMEIVRGVFLKGVGISVLWPQMIALAVFGTVVLTLSALRFRKSLD